MALRLSQEEFTRGVQTYSRDMYRPPGPDPLRCRRPGRRGPGSAAGLAVPGTGCETLKPLRAWLVKISVNCARQLNRRSRREVYLEDLPPQAAAREDPRAGAVGRGAVPAPGPAGGGGAVLL